MSAQDCKSCPEGVYCEDSGHAYAPVYISLRSTADDTDVCAST